MLQLLLPPFQVGQSVGGGDCFFDSVSQGLKQLKPERDFTVKSLRQVCKSFAQSQSEDEQSWLKEALKKENEQIKEYIQRIEFTVNDVDQKSEEVKALGLTSPIRGRSEIEGRIICAEYNVTLYVAEKRIVKREEIWAHKIVDSEGSRSINASDYKDNGNTVHVVYSTSDLHFDPVLRVRAVQHSKQQSPLSDDSSEEDVKMTPGEELFYAVKCNDSQAEKLTKIIKIFKRAPKLDVNFQGINKDTCLHVAVRKMELQVIELLVQIGARIDVINDKNRSPLDVARRINRQDIVKILKSGSQQFSAEGQMEPSQENGEERNKQWEEVNVISCLTNGPFEEDLESQKDDQKIKMEPFYKKRPGTAGINGYLYETRLLMLFLLQAEAKVKNGKITSFYLAANMEGTGNFDDVAFMYKYFENGKEQSKIIFLQSKHHDNPSTILANAFLDGNIKDFKLKNYLSSYEIIKKKNPFPQGDIQMSDFVIYTNDKFYFNESSKGIKEENKEANNVAEKTEKDFLKVEVEPDNILYLMKDREEYYCKLEATKRVKMALDDGKIGDKTIIEEFLKGLKLFFNQPNVEKLKNAMKRIITDVFDIKEQDDTQLIYDNVENTMLKLWKQRGTVKYLTEHDKLFNEAKGNISNLKLVGLAISEVEPIISLGLNFKSNEIERLSKLIGEKRILHIISDAVLLSAIKVYQTLKKMLEYKSKDDSSRYIFLNLTSALKLKNKVISAFESEMRNVLVIKCDETETSFTQFYEQLKDIVESNNSKKIILITRKQFKYNFSMDSGFVQEKDINNSFTDLDIESQELLLKEKKVKFQGIEMELGTLIDEKSKYLIGADILSQLINNEQIEVGKPLDDLDEIKCYYINRILHRQVSINKGCFKERNIKDIFVVSNIRKNELKLITGAKTVRKFDEMSSDRKKPVRFIILDDNENVQENWKQLYTKYQTYNIHWLKKEGDKFIWQASHRSISNLRKFVDIRDINEYEADKITNIVDRIVIVSAEPGMGKSVLLTKLAKKEKKADPSLWLVRINLNDHTKELNGTNFDNINLNEIIHFLSKISGLKSTLEKKLLEHRLKSHGKIAFLFDGFDEISPDYKDKVITLLQTLKETNIDKMWITTRLHMKNELEDKLSVLSYTLKPLSTKDQIYFLKKFWRKKLGLKNDTDDNRLNTYIGGLLIFLSTSIADNERNLTGIPLQTRIVAEVYQDQFKEFHKSNENSPNFSSELNLLNLYQSFIKKKYDIWVDKNKVDLTNISISQVYKEYQEKFILQHQLLALECLFSNQEVRSLFSSKERKLIESYKKKIVEGHEKTGIVNYVLNNTIKFIHRTFAEYFAAQWLADNQENNKAQKFLQIKLFRIENSVLRYFFDQMLANDTERREIHIAVLNNDIQKVKELSLGSLNGKVDKGGRTALHLAAAYGLSDIVEILTNINPTAIYIKDKIFRWRPLNYADKSSHWPVADLLLQKGAPDNDMVQTILSIKNKLNYGDILLHGAANTGLVQLAEFLIKKEVDIDAKSPNNMTPLHSAARGGHIEVCKLLIEKEADINNQDNSRNTALHYAALSGKLDIFEFLIEKGANINIQNNTGDTVLHYAAKIDNVHVVKFLVEKGANVNIQNNIGDTVLNVACYKNLTDAVTLLIENGADCNCSNKEGIVPLHYAALIGNLNLVKFLIEKGADFKSANKKNDTVLHYATLGGNLDLVKFLTEKKVNLNCQNNNDDTVLHYAAQKGNLDVAKFLVEKGADLTLKNKLGHTVLHSAAGNSNWDVVKVLIEKKVDLNAQDINGDTIQHYAALSGNLNMLKLLIEKGANFKCQNNTGNTVLHSAAQSGNFEVVKFLLDKGANFQCKNIFGRSVLHYAAERSNLNVVKFLIEKGADFNPGNDNNNNTVLHSAAWGGNIDVVKLLIEKGADYKYQNIFGRSALDAATAKSNWDIVKYLLSIGADFYCQNKFGAAIQRPAAGNFPNSNVPLDLVCFSGFQ